MPIRTCEPCTFSTPVKCNWDRHLLTSSHLKQCVIINTDSSDNVKKSTFAFECCACAFTCKTKSNYTRHLETPAHCKKTGKISTASMVTQDVEIIEDSDDNHSSQAGASDIRTVLKNSEAIDLNDYINQMLQTDQLSMFKFIETKHHGRLITLTNVDSIHTLVTNGLGYHAKVFYELFNNPLTNPIICNNPQDKECRFKFGETWKTQTLSSYLHKDHICESCKTINQDFVPTCQKCMECTRTLRPQYENIGGYEIDALISDGISPYERSYKVTAKTFKENIIHFHSCCLRGMVSNFSQLALYAFWNTLKLYKCGEIKLSKDTIENETLIMILLNNLPSDIMEPKEKQLFKSIYTILCEICSKN